MARLFFRCAPPKISRGEFREPDAAWIRALNHPMKFAHVVNPVRVDPSSDLFVAQPITFESMRIARENAGPALDVELFAAFYPEDADHVPVGFRRLRTLD